MHVAELDYELPEELIAQEPSERRDGARLLLIDRDRDSLSHRRVVDLPSLLRPSLLVVNDTRVLRARLHGRKESGGKVELLLLECLKEESEHAQVWSAMGRASKGLRPTMVVRLTPTLHAEVLSKNEEGELTVRLHSETAIGPALREAGHVPLPPYIRRPDKESDQERYQTIFAEHEGAVAAPTAGLHFSNDLVEALKAVGHRFASVTLHVGPGTFRPVKADRLEDHPMHTEAYTLSAQTCAEIERAKAEGRPVVAIGTTVVRALESSALRAEALKASESVDAPTGLLVEGMGRTDLLIQPPYNFRVIDGLWTNFHLPRSTLLALVMAFGGEQKIREAYRAAIEERYRFFSYGDAMLLRDEKLRPKSSDTQPSDTQPSDTPPSDTQPSDNQSRG